MIREPGQCAMLLATAAAAFAAAPPAVAQAVQPDEAATEATLALVGGRLVDGYGGRPLDHAVILIEGDRIVASAVRNRSMFHKARSCSTSAA